MIPDAWIAHCREQLTPRQLEILAFIMATVCKYGRTPTFHEIMDKFDYRSPHAVTYHLKPLVKHRLIRRRGKHRSIEVVGLKWVPVAVKKRKAKVGAK